MKPKPFNVKRAKKQLDTLWSRAIRDRDGYCQKCGALGVGQAAHIFSRRNLTTRWDKENGVTLCYACHIHWAHRRPVEFALWVMEKLGREKFKALEKRTREPYDSSNFKTDFEKIKKTLTNKTMGSKYGLRRTI
jgi:hypothetical protein